MHPHPLDLQSHASKHKHARRNANLALVAVAVLFCAPAWAVNRCQLNDGSVVYQDLPCAVQSKAKLIDARPANTTYAAPKKPTSPAIEPEQDEAAPQPKSEASSTPAAPAKNMLEEYADMCLDWYRPLLKNPRGAYYSNEKMEGRVLSLTIHGTNTYGGVVTKDAACEIHLGRLDSDWTKIHAKREGWGKN